MIVTDLQYNLEKRLVQKLDLMIARVMQEHPKKDAWLCNEGGEGEGKSNSAIAEAYYIKSKTGMDIHMFMRLDEVIKFAQTNKKKIIIWDEPSLDALSSDALKETNKNLLRLAMTIRSHRHFFIINFTKFHKFNEYVVVERCLGMVHMYSRKETQAGRFVYIKKKNLELLWNDFRTRRQRNYRLHSTFRGSFPDIIEKLFDKMKINLNGIPNASYKQYELEKTKGIASIGEKKYSKERIMLNNLRYGIGKLKIPITTREQLAQQLEINSRRIGEWRKLSKISEYSLGNPPKIDLAAAEHSSLGLEDDENFSETEEDGEDEE